ncbi:hypothetical protein E0494_05940 [Marinilabiliaceae bacterium JC040]|nr:hypothetical protein [Marinilabiliaceae bacterium JC040]
MSKSILCKTWITIFILANVILTSCTKNDDDNQHTPRINRIDQFQGIWLEEFTPESFQHYYYFTGNILKCYKYIKKGDKYVVAFSLEMKVLNLMNDKFKLQLTDNCYNNKLTKLVKQKETAQTQTEIDKIDDDLTRLKEMYHSRQTIEYHFKNKKLFVTRIRIEDDHSEEIISVKKISRFP